MHNTDGGFYDEIGGYHCDAAGYSPSGKYCGECCRTTCKGCDQNTDTPASRAREFINSRFTKVN